jgi:hypothetical protein
MIETGRVPCAPAPITLCPYSYVSGPLRDRKTVLTMVNTSRIGPMTHTRTVADAK